MKRPAVRHVVGAMSGTSADGVDAAVCRVECCGDAAEAVSACVLVHRHRAYPPELRRRIFAARGGATTAVTLGELARLGEEVSLTYAAAVNEALAAARMRPEEIACVAAHGQTLFHDPPRTIQWLDPALLAAETGCVVVSDFRRADCAAGGQGAPLVPYADHLLFRHAERSRVMLNLGGIANVTSIPAGAGLGQVIAFDTGPGNCVCDHLCQREDAGGPGYDEGGRRARAGRAIEALVEAALAGDYFRRPPPKSTDGPEMIALFEEARRRACPADATAEDLLASACAVTARAVRRAVERWVPGAGKVRVDVIASGGGTANEAMMACLSSELAGLGAEVTSSDDLGVPSASKEALAFALLGAATLDGLAGNVPSATGARRPVVLGSITPRP